MSSYLCAFCEGTGKTKHLDFDTREYFFFACIHCLGTGEIEDDKPAKFSARRIAPTPPEPLSELETLRAENARLRSDKIHLCNALKRIVNSSDFLDTDRVDYGKRLEWFDTLWQERGLITEIADNTQALGGGDDA